MRLDKFLKVSCIIKRRTVANEACDNKHVFVNDKPAKASYEVKVGDIVKIIFGEKILCFEIAEIKEHVQKSEAGSLYRIIV